MMFVKAFVIGGLICVIGQILIDLTKLTPGKILTGYVVAGVILGAVGLYEPLISFAGSGASVPLLGFGSLLAKGTQKAVTEEGLIGILKGPLTAGSIGITTALISGLLVSFVTKPRSK